MKFFVLLCSTFIFSLGTAKASCLQRCKDEGLIESKCKYICHGNDSSLGNDIRLSCYKSCRKKNGHMYCASSSNCGSGGDKAAIKQHCYDLCIESGSTHSYCFSEAVCGVE